MRKPAKQSSTTGIRRAVRSLERELQHKCHADIRGLIKPVLADVRQGNRKSK